MIVFLICFNVLLGLFIKIYSKLTCGQCLCSKHLVGKTVIMTDSDDGIGYETAMDLAERGARVILACRDDKRGTDARDQIVANTGNKDVHFKKLDFASFHSIKQFAEDVLKTENRLDILINNAGTITSGKDKTEDGLLASMQINYFGPFLLTNLLLPLLKSSSPSRIINVSSSDHHFGTIDFQNLNMEKETNATFGNSKVYYNSKLFIILMALELSERLKGSGVTVNSLHPGFVQTNLAPLSNPIYVVVMKIIMKMFYKTAQEGAQTSIYLSVSPELVGVTGCYYADCRLGNASRLAQDKERAKKLWEASERLVKL